MKGNKMKLSSLSFQARLRRQLDANGKPATKKQWLDSYDKSIKRIQKQKERAIELDTFMRSDEVKAKLEQLPSSANIQMISNLWIGDGEIENGAELEINDLMLDYDGADKLKYFSSPNIINIMQDKRLCCAQTKNGEIDKDGILAWLDTMINLWH